MQRNTRRVLLTATAIAVVSGLVAFAVVRSVDSQESTNREIGLSDEDRRATHAAGFAATIVEIKARNVAIAAANPSLDDMRRGHVETELIGVGYRTVAEMAARPFVTIIARGVVTSQRLSLGHADDGRYSEVISTLASPSSLKGQLASAAEIAIPVSVTAEGNGYILGTSNAYALPREGDEVVVFLQTLPGNPTPVVVPWGVYIVRPDQTLGLPVGASDQLKVDGTPASQFFADVQAAIADEQ